MNTILKLPSELTIHEQEEMAHLAMLGFGRDDQEMFEDTVRHLTAADEVQYATSGGRLQAFSMYRSCLWRLSH